MELTNTQLLEKGEIKLSENDVKKYNSDFDSLMKEIGFLVMKDIKEFDIKKEKYMIVFFPVGRQNLVDLAKNTNLSYRGEELISPLFSINYDKSFQSTSFEKRYPSIPSTLTYMILAY